jgi:hypothetical protein
MLVPGKATHHRHEFSVRFSCLDAHSFSYQHTTTVVLTPSIHELYRTDVYLALEVSEGRFPCQ